MSARLLSAALACLLLSACSGRVASPFTPARVEPGVFASDEMNWRAGESLQFSPASFSQELLDASGERVGRVSVFQFGTRQEIEDAFNASRNMKYSVNIALELQGTSFAYIYASGGVGIGFQNCRSYVNVFIEQHPLMVVEDYARALERKLDALWCEKAAE